MTIFPMTEGSPSRSSAARRSVKRICLVTVLRSFPEATQLGVDQPPRSFPRIPTIPSSVPAGVGMATITGSSLVSCAWQ
jgi:hypothetical protein